MDQLQLSTSTDKLSDHGLPLPCRGGLGHIMVKASIEAYDADNNSSQYHPLRFCLRTRSRLVPYKTEKEMLPNRFSQRLKTPSQGSGITPAPCSQVGSRAGAPAVGGGFPALLFR